MMITIFYDLLFLIPLAVAALSWTGRSFGASAGEGVKIALCVLFAVYFVLIRRLKLRERLILLGLASSSLLAVIFYHPKGERLEFISSYSWIGYIFIIALLGQFLCIASEKYIRIRVITSAILVALTVISLFTGSGMSKAGVCAVYFFAIISIAELVFGKSHPEYFALTSNGRRYNEPDLQFPGLHRRFYSRFFDKTTRKALRLGIYQDRIFGGKKHRSKAK